MLLAAKVTGRPVKWICTRSEAFLSDAQARDNVTDAELALDKDGNFLGVRVKTIAAVGAYHAGRLRSRSSATSARSRASTRRRRCMPTSPAVFTNTNPVRPYRGNGRPEAAYVIERLVDLAADQLGIDPVELRRRNTIPPDAMPFKTGLTFTYDCGEFEKNMDMALEMADAKGFPARRAEARKHGKLRGLGISNTIERAAAPSYEGAEIRFDRSGAVDAVLRREQSRPGPRDRVQADRLRPASASIRSEVHLRPGRHRPGVLRRRHRRLALGHDRRLGRAAWRPTRSRRRPRRSRRMCSRSRPRTCKFEDGMFSSPKTNQTMTIKDVAMAAAQPGKAAEGHGGRA